MLRITLSEIEWVNCHLSIVATAFSLAVLIDRIPIHPVLHGTKDPNLLDTFSLGLTPSNLTFRLLGIIPSRGGQAYTAQRAPPARDWYCRAGILTRGLRPVHETCGDLTKLAEKVLNILSFHKRPVHSRFSGVFF